MEQGPGQMRTGGMRIYQRVKCEILVRQILFLLQTLLFSLQSQSRIMRVHE